MEGTAHTRLAGGAQRVRGALVFLLAWALLDTILNLRLPSPEPLVWFLIPSVDTVALFVVLVVLGARRRPVAPMAHAALVGWLVLVRWFRVVDGIESHYLGRSLHLYTDLPLAPELVRLLHSTLPLWQLSLLGLAIVAGTVALIALAHWALRVVERGLCEPDPRSLFAAVVAAFAVLSVIAPSRDERHSGAFAASFFDRVATEADFWLHAAGYRTERLAEIRRVQQVLARTPSDLARLGKADVYLFVVESYGQTLLDEPFFAGSMRRFYADMDRDLSSNGFSIASAVLRSPTSGGSSWLAHATIATGVWTEDQPHYDLLMVSKPKTIAQFFRAAGYRTVAVQPGTTRPWLKGAYPFDVLYSAETFDYRGPSYEWSTMPDQYVVDFVRRREIEHRTGPLFIEYALVTSHAPWSDQPALVDDWSSIEDGSCYRRLPTLHFDVSWLNLAHGRAAYLRSIQYDLEVLKRYLVTFVADNSVVLIVGDHQPATAITGKNAAKGVPIHVVSRKPAVVEQFVARGFTRGMQPPAGEALAGMETLLALTLAAFSSDSPGT